MFAWSRWSFVCCCVLAFAVAACSDPGGQTGQAGSDASGDTDALDAASDADHLDASPDSGEDVDDGGSPEDTAPSDAGDATDVADADDAGPTTRTLADYRACTTDSDCPVGLGNCVTEVPLNRTTQDGRDVVSVSDLFESVEDGEGICTFVCTDDVAACEDLSMNGTTQDPVPHECQLVFVDEPPYPTSPPPFPFDDQLDPGQQELGAAFGALCRPPFGLDDEVDDSICASCQTQDECGDEGAICWDFLAGAAADESAGTCLPPCADNDECPTGFVCDVTDADENSFCRPIESTCSNCRDHDQDGFGDGRCADDGTPTPHDCDDTNADAYFDPDNPEHAFPEFCGEQDFNCNGLSDATEEVGEGPFGAEHCTACFDACEGAVDNGQRACTNDDSGTPACTAACDTDADGNPTWADCNGDLSDGCEVEVDVDPEDNPEYFVWADADGDGRGDPNAAQFLCDGHPVPTGFVDNADDCDDTNPDAYGAGDAGPAAEEVCDGADNDCDGTIDGPSASDALEFWADNDHDQYGDPNDSVVACSAPQDYVGNDDDCDDDDDEQYPGNTEVCDEKDNDCDGDTDEGVTTTYYHDNDQDTFGDPNDSQEACSPPFRHVLDNTDCDDYDDNTFPGAAENDSLSACMRDRDGDGYGDDSVPSNIQPGSDCRDDIDTAYPGAVEICDMDNGQHVDSDCDGSANEGCPTDLDLGTSSTSLGIPSSYSSGGGSYECNDGFVLANFQVRTGTAGHITGLRGLCEPLSIRDSDGDGMLDQATVAGSSEYWLDWVGSDANSTSESLVCADSPAQVLTSAAGEMKDDYLLELTLTCSTVDINLNSSSSPVSTVSLSSGPSKTFGTDNPDVGDTQISCGGNSVAVGFDAFAFYHPTNYPIGWRIEGIRLKCRTLDLATRP